MEVQLLWRVQEFLEGGELCCALQMQEVTPLHGPKEQIMVV